MAEDCIDDVGWPSAGDDVIATNVAHPHAAVMPRTTAPDQPPALPIPGTTSTYRPFELLVEKRSAGINALMQMGLHPVKYRPGASAEDWRTRIWGAERANVNAGLEAVGLELFTVDTDVLKLPTIDGVHLNYVYFTAKGTSVGPYGWPKIAPAPQLPGAVSIPPGPPTLAVFDTGLPVGWEGWHPGLTTVIDALPNDLKRIGAATTANVDPELDRVGDGVLDHAVGHGLFISGLVHRVAPTIRLHMERVMTYRQTDDALMGSELMKSDEPVISLSMIGSCERDADEVIDKKRQPIGLRLAIEAILAADRVVVAAAGNGGKELEQQFPATMDGVIAVGAYDSRRGHAAERASFSNYGAAVDCWAPGVCLRSTYVEGLEEHGSGEPFEGWATWSGTSFATPIVAARIASLVESMPSPTPRQVAEQFLDNLPIASFSPPGKLLTFDGLTVE